MCNLGKFPTDTKPVTGKIFSPSEKISFTYRHYLYLVKITFYSLLGRGKIVDFEALLVTADGHKLFVSVFLAWIRLAYIDP